MNVVNKLITVNYTVGRAGSPINLIILHTMQGFLTGTDAWFNNPAAQASAHEGVGLNGDVHLYVDPSNMAWGAGNLGYNRRAINIETEDNRHPDDVVRTPDQLESVAQRVALHCRQNNIPCDRAHIIRHGEVPGTSHKDCPGNLPIDQIIARAAAILGAGTAIVVSSTTQPSFTPIGVTRLSVVAGTANVRTLPSVGAGSVVTSTLTKDQTFDIDGYIHTGVVINSDGYEGDLWVHSTKGHWVFGPLTSFEEARFAAPAPAPLVTLDFTEQAGSVRITPDIGANLRTAPQTGQANVSRAVNKETTLAVVGFVTGAAVDGDSKWWRTSDGLYVSDAVVTFITPQTAPPVLSVEPPAVIQTQPQEDPAPAATPPIVPAPADPWDTLDKSVAGLYEANVAEPVKVADLTGNLADATLKPSQRVRVAGQYELNGVVLARTVEGVAHGTAYAINMSALTKVLSSGPLVSDIQPPSAAPAAPATPANPGPELTTREKVLALIAAVATLLDTINPFKSKKGSK